METSKELKTYVVEYIPNGCHKQLQVKAYNEQSAKDEAKRQLTVGIWEITDVEELEMF
jgi:hypothetical protein